MADTLVSEAAVSSSVVLIDCRGELVVLSRAGAPCELGTVAESGAVVKLDDRWKSFPLEVAEKTVGVVAVTGAPVAGSEQHQLLEHLVSLGALSLHKALLHEQSREQARHDSLTGLLGHRVFHEVLEGQIAAATPFSVLLFDIDDFKQINDLHGHQTGDHTLRLVSDALRQGTRSGDSVFRIGGEEFCALLPGLTEQDAYAVSEGIRQRIAAIVSTLPNPVTVSAGVASFPNHGRLRDDLRTAARLHDIGKLAVPDAILNKPGRLDEDEFRIVKTHSVVGAELLTSWGLPRAAAIVLQHHERIDGTGYPMGLRGDEICLESRIIHTADAYIAMTRDRPYRAAMKRDDAFAELERNRGTQFDPAVVAALITLERARPAAAQDPIAPRPPAWEDGRPLAA